VKAKVSKKKDKTVVIPIKNFVRCGLEVIVKNKEGKVVERRVKKADK
jgi:hypothetical protein